MDKVIGLVIPLELGEQSPGVWQFHFSYTYPLPNGTTVNNNNPIRPVSNSSNPLGGWEPLLAKALKDTAFQENGVVLDAVIVPDLKLYKV